MEIDTELSPQGCKCNKKDLELESLPEEEWVEVPEGLHAKFVYSLT